MASTYLTRTFGSAGNRQSWTWSGWIKKSKVYIVQIQAIEKFSLGVILLIMILIG